MKNELEKFLDVALDFALKLREREVTSVGEVAELSKAIGDLRAVYQHQDSLPKELAGAIIDLSTGFYSSADCYPEPLRSELFHVFDPLADQLRNLCY